MAAHKFDWGSQPPHGKDCKGQSIIIDFAWMPAIRPFVCLSGRNAGASYAPGELALSVSRVALSKFSAAGRNCYVSLVIPDVSAGHAAATC